MSIPRAITRSTALFSNPPDCTAAGNLTATSTTRLTVDPKCFPIPGDIPCSGLAATRNSVPGSTAPTFADDLVFGNRAYIRPDTAHSEGTTTLGGYQSRSELMRYDCNSAREEARRKLEGDHNTTSCMSSPGLCLNLSCRLLNLYTSFMQNYLCVQKQSKEDRIASLGGYKSGGTTETSLSASHCSEKAIKCAVRAKKGEEMTRETYYAH